MFAIPTGADSGEERVLRALYRLIAARAVAPGQQIRQEELAKAAGVSRLPVRQALTRLGAEGLVRLERNRGAFLVELSVGQLGELHAVRDLLEGEALRLAASRVTDVDLEALEKHLVGVEQAMANDSLAEVYEQNRLFHFGIFDLAGNRYLLEMIYRCWLRAMPYQIAYLGARHRWGKVAEQHRQIFQALTDGDAQGLRSCSHAHRDQFVTELIPWLRSDHDSAERSG